MTAHTADTSSISEEYQVLAASTKALEDTIVFRDRIFRSSVNAGVHVIIHKAIACIAMENK